MSIAIFNGLAGRLKVLVDRITADRAAGLDHLDADITSRAPASTAMSREVWTDALAALLGSAAGQPIVPKSPIAAGLVQLESAVPAGPFVDIVNLTSADGYVTRLCFAGANFFSAELIIDSRIVWSVSNKYGDTLVIGSPVVDGAPIHFRSSLRLRVIGPITVTCNYVRTR